MNELNENPTHTHTHVHTHTHKHVHNLSVNLLYTSNLMTTVMLTTPVQYEPILQDFWSERFYISRESWKNTSHCHIHNLLYPFRQLHLIWLLVCFELFLRYFLEIPRKSWRNVSSVAMSSTESSPVVWVCVTLFMAVTHFTTWKELSLRHFRKHLNFNLDYFLPEDIHSVQELMSLFWIHSQ